MIAHGKIVQEAFHAIAGFWKLADIALGIKKPHTEKRKLLLLPTPPRKPSPIQRNSPVTNLSEVPRDDDHFLGLQAARPISDELARQGHSVYECLAISEVFALAQEHLDAQIVIAANIEERWATEIQAHYPTLHLKPGATAKNILWELGLKGSKVQ